MNFRQAKGKLVHRLDTGIDKKFSNFLFVDQLYASSPVMRRIFSLARRHQYQSLLVEEIKEDDCLVLATANNALKIRRNDYQKSLVHRISFFRTPINQETSHSDFIGYVIFKRDFFAAFPNGRVHVFESVIRPFRQADDNNFIHCQRDYEINTALGKFWVRGVLYAQQNDLTAVCAHVGLRTALSCAVEEGDVTYEQMNLLAGIDHKSRQVGSGSGGLQPDDMERILEGLKVSFYKVVHEPTKKLHLMTEYQRDLYGCIESGFPTLVGFQMDDPKTNGTGPRHAIPIFGHTFNEDTWMPQAHRAYFGGAQSYFPSENWLSTFVVHDDNFGPYLCLPRHFLSRDKFRLLYGLKPQQTVFDATQAEAIGFDFFNAIASSQNVDNYWYARYKVFAQRSWLVLRTILVSKGDYLKYLEKAYDRDGKFLEPAFFQSLRAVLPKVFWMVEASAPDLFNTSRRKFGEVLLACDQALANPLSDSILLAARLPGLIYFRSGDQLEVRSTQLKGHTPLFTFEDNGLTSRLFSSQTS